MFELQNHGKNTGANFCFANSHQGIMAFACVMAMLGLEIIVESIRKLLSKVRYVQDTLVVFLLSLFWHNYSGILKLFYFPRIFVAKSSWG
jgi:hypothetical protein